MVKYQPVDSTQSPRFCGVRTFMRLPHVQTLEEVDFAVVGVPFDTASTFRVGARFGPSAIRNVSHQIRPYNVNLGVNVFDYCSGIDYGDISVVPGYIEDSYVRIEDGLAPLFEAGVIPIVLGGDHSITLPELRAAAKKYGKIALVHFDSHLDTINEYFRRKYNHGTPFRRACEEGILDVEHSIQIGMRGSFYSAQDLKDSEDLGFKVITSNQIREIGFSALISQIKERVADRPAFLTFDIDFVDPAYAPGTGTTEVGGFTSYETLYLIGNLKDINFIGYDIVEVLPSFDPAEITAYLAANIGFEFAAIIAFQKKNREGK